MISRLRAVLPFLTVPLVWVALSTLFVVRSFNKDFLTLFTDTDDATRLVVVRDLMSGQNWFDHIEHRLNTPFGAAIHWSRLIDLPLGWLIEGLDLVVPGKGEHIALFVWPLLLLLPALYLVAVLTRRLVGPGNELTALVIAALAIPVFSEFAPGRIDHHNVQIVLVLWLAIEAHGIFRANAAAWRAGIAAATSLVIGAETALIIAAAISAFGLHWVIDQGFAPRLWRFGAAFAAAMLMHFLIAVGPADWFAVQCDATSIVFVVAALGVGAVFAVLVRLPFTKKDWGKRLASGLAGAALVAFVLLRLFPACAAGPFASLEPWLRTAWLDRVIEVQPLWKGFLKMPAYAIALSLPVLAALAAVSITLIKTRSPDWKAWLTYALLLLAAVLGLFLQLRGGRLSALLAVPGAVLLLHVLRGLYLERRGRRKLFAALGLVAGWIGSSGTVLFVLIDLAFPAPAAAKDPWPLVHCLVPSAFTELAGLSPARVAAPVDLGPYLLLMTPHAVIGAPYHRNSDGIADSFRIFGSPEAEARAILARRGIDLVVSCAALLGLSGGGIDAPDSLKMQLGKGEVPDWLTPLPSSDGALRTYRVAR